MYVLKHCLFIYLVVFYIILNCIVCHTFIVIIIYTEFLKLEKKYILYTTS